MMPPSSFLAGHLLLGSQPTRKSSLFPVEKNKIFILQVVINWKLLLG